LISIFLSILLGRYSLLGAEIDRRKGARMAREQLMNPARGTEVPPPVKA